jgi:hypothetical protein
MSKEATNSFGATRAKGSLRKAVPWLTPVTQVATYN